MFMKDRRHHVLMQQTMNAFIFTSMYLICVAQSLSSSSVANDSLLVADREYCSDGSEPMHALDIDNPSYISCSFMDDGEDNCTRPFICDRSTFYCCLSVTIQLSTNMTSSIDNDPFVENNDDQVNRLTLQSDADHERYCGVDGRLLKVANNQLVNCTVDDDCLPPSMCKEAGVCCLLALGQEPPPVGCPIGTRPLRNSAGVELTCSPNVADSCPGGTMCYEDALDGTYRCCGKDPGEGCPTGSRAVKTGGQLTPCTPGSAASACTGAAICQWSYLIDRYQCCEADNGCPHSYAPIRTGTGSVQACNNPSNSFCPTNSNCRFNFWTASYQCCALNFVDLCPSSLVPYIDSATSTVRQCSSSSACPLGYSCQGVNGGDQICCGNPGSCPIGQTAVTDAQGRLSSCSPASSSSSAFTSCPTGSSCQPTSSSTTINSQQQYLCCSSTQSQFACANIGALPYPSAANPQQCSLIDPLSCPAPNQCQASSVAGISICCFNGAGAGVSVGNSCPPGWALQNGIATYCSPTAMNGCSGISSCLRSTLAQQQFICCTPALSSSPTPSQYYSCPFGNAVMQPTGVGQNRFCSPTNLCTATQTCQQAVGNPNIYICCQADSGSSSNTFNCPNNAIAEQQQQPFGGSAIRQCTNFNPICSNGFVCQQSTNGNVMICCSTETASPQYSCGGGYSGSNTSPALNAGQNIICQLGYSGACPIGSTCQSASNNPSVSICCYGAGNGNIDSNYYTCPNNAHPQADTITGRAYLECNINAVGQCNNGYLCVRSANNERKTICCSMQTLHHRPIAGGGVPQPECPYASRPLYEYGIAGEPINLQFCRRRGTFSSCPKGYSCRDAINSGGIDASVCCSENNDAGQQTTTMATTSTTISCPINFAPSIDVYGNTVFCNQANPSICPGGSHCMTAIGAPNLSICCRSVDSETICPNRQDALVSGSGELELCNEPGSVCSLSGFTCQVSPIIGRFVCCGFEEERAKVPMMAMCADGRNTYSHMQGEIYTCNRRFSDSCPFGFECAESTVVDTFVCCAIRSSSRPNNQQQSDAMSCPVGWTPFLSTIDRLPRFCQNANDINCPTGYSCTQSNRRGTFICCRYASALTCNNGANVLTIGGGQVRLCQPNDDDCPRGYLCLASNVANVNVCCQQPAGQQQQLRCASDQSQPAMIGTNARYCSSNTECPFGFACQSSNQLGIDICCRTTTGANVGVCGADAEAYVATADGRPLTCMQRASDTCPNTYFCRHSYIDPNHFYCCRPTSSSSSQDAISTTNNNRARCIDRTTQLSTENLSAVACAPLSVGDCSNGFECSKQTTSQEYLCCSNVVRRALPSLNDDNTTTTAHGVSLTEDG